MYGFRIIGPILIGASRLPPKIFLPLNIFGAVAWALIFTTLGYVGGEVIGPWLHSRPACEALGMVDSGGGGSDCGSAVAETPGFEALAHYSSYSPPDNQPAGKYRSWAL
jgi:hypothetical protein